MEPRTRLHLLTVVVLAGSAFTALPARARVLMPQKTALAIAFPHGNYERKSAFLTDAQASAAEKAAGAKLETKLWTYYVAGSTTAYFDSHLVRTMNETIMVVVGSDAKVAFVEVLSFAEPEDFMASKKWLKQFEGRPLDDELAVRRGLRGISGATLTSEAAASAVRRVLAVHGVLNAKPAK